ncbi:uncharacterized protein [Chlorocebus sabaeus]|uniref:uncharacterized protein n=1 Tax=Chlorocebus sabaeus TaxID=60711 RepID=UPI003BF97F06
MLEEILKFSGSGGPSILDDVAEVQRREKAIPKLCSKKATYALALETQTLFAGIETIFKIESGNISGPRQGGHNPPGATTLPPGWFFGTSANTFSGVSFAPNRDGGCPEVPGVEAAVPVSTGKWARRDAAGQAAPGEDPGTLTCSLGLGGVGGAGRCAASPCEVCGPGPARLHRRVGRTSARRGCQVSRARSGSGAHGSEGVGVGDPALTRERSRKVPEEHGKERPRTSPQQAGADGAAPPSSLEAAGAPQIRWREAEVHFAEQKAQGEKTFDLERTGGVRDC